MTLGQFMVVYLMAGGGVADAVYLSLDTESIGQRCFQIASAALFWPLYVPLLLSYREEKKATPLIAEVAAVPIDELALAITQVDAELDSALQSLDGWAEDVLAREKDRMHELRTVWNAQAKRIREMDRLLSLPVGAPLAVNLGNLGEGTFSERLRHSQDAIRQNRQLLHQVRERSFQDLLGTLAWVRELVSMIHLAKFTGAPAARAEELVAQIATAVEGISALTWQEEGIAQQ
jgi:hypothetical protein